jgi:hypothetical protein
MLDQVDSDQPDFGNFTLELAYAILDPAKMDSDDELLEALAIMEDANASSVDVVDQKMAGLHAPAISDIPRPETPASPGPFPSPTTSKPKAKRFKTVSESHIRHLFDSRQAAATKRNTAWGVKIFQGKQTNK